MKKLFQLRVWSEKSELITMPNNREEGIPLNVDENKNALPEKKLGGSQESVGTWSEWDKEKRPYLCIKLCLLLLYRKKPT